MSAATVVVVAGVSWLTGTLPGVASPFDRQPAHHPTHQQAPPTPSGEEPGAEAGVPSEPLFVPPGLAKPHSNNGNHNGQTGTHTNNGNHNGQTGTHTNNGNHNGQTGTHTNNGNHNGQTGSHQNNGNHNGQTGTQSNNGNHNGQTGTHGGGQANGHRS